MSKIQDTTAAAIHAAAEHAVTITHQDRARDLQDALDRDGADATGFHSLHDEALNLLDEVIQYVNTDPITQGELHSLRRAYLAEATRNMGTAK